MSSLVWCVVLVFGFFTIEWRTADSQGVTKVNDFPSSNYIQNGILMQIMVTKECISTHNFSAGIMTSIWHYDFDTCHVCQVHGSGICIRSQRINCILRTQLLLAHLVSCFCCSSNTLDKSSASKVSSSAYVWYVWVKRKGFRQWQNVSLTGLSLSKPTLICTTDQHHKSLLDSSSILTNNFQSLSQSLHRRYITSSA